MRAAAAGLAAYLLLGALMARLDPATALLSGGGVGDLVDPVGLLAMLALRLALVFGLPFIIGRWLVARVLRSAPARIGSCGG